MTKKIAIALALGSLSLTGVSCSKFGSSGTSNIGQTSTNAANSTSAVLGQVFGSEQSGSSYSPGSYQTDGYDQGNMDYVDVTPVEPSSSPAAPSGSYAPAPSQVYTPPVSSTPPPASPRNGGAVHTVQKGDTLYGISRRYKTSVAAIQSANSLNDATIHPGDILTIR